MALLAVVGAVVLIPGFLKKRVKEIFLWFSCGRLEALFLLDRVLTSSSQVVLVDLIRAATTTAR